MNIFKRAIRKTRFLGSYARSLVIGRMKMKNYRDVRKFLIFVGYPRSGHSLIAALIDAHPNTLISMEWGALSHLMMGYRKAQIFYSIERISRIFTEELHNAWTGYSYRVEGQSQGMSDHLLLMGDKLAGQTSLILEKQPDLLDQLSQEVGEICILHVIRNPFDTITTMRKRSMEKVDNPNSKEGLDFFTDRFFERVEVVNNLKKSGRYKILDVYHEDFIANPGKGLGTILEFLDLNYTQEFLDACSAIVYKAPNLSRLQADWSSEMKSRVQSSINSYDFLSRYYFDS